MQARGVESRTTAQQSETPSAYGCSRSVRADCRARQHVPVWIFAARILAVTFRPSDWAPLADSDPLSGDPEAIFDEAARLRRLAAGMTDQVARLRRVGAE